MSRANTSLVISAILVSAIATACGGSEPPAKGPEMEPVATAAPAADMPAPPATAAAAADAKPATDTAAPGVPDPAAAPTTLALPTATAKIEMKGKKAAKVELKSDGTVANGGKAVAKVSGMALQSPDGGKTFLTVGSDGAVTTSDGGSYGSFAGDELTIAKGGDKLTLADDGTLTMTSAGKAAPLGKFDGAGTAKRSAVLAAAFVLAPPAAEKPAAAAGAKPAAAPAKK
jgi:hypothetical protein